mgnify:CR=1 FL=1
MIRNDRSESSSITYGPFALVHMSHVISVYKLFNNITINLSRLATVMIASVNNLLLIIPRTVARLRI